MKKKNFFISLFIFLILTFFSDSVFAQKSASLFLSPGSGSYQVGKTFSINVAVRSEQQAINAAEATLKFDPNIIRVKNISKSGSIFSLWPVEPNFSNSAGTINFTGGSPNAYKGSSGRIVTIVFEALKEGKTTVSFTNGQALAADGLGTDITDQLIGGTYTLIPGTSPEPTQQSQPAGLLPSAPKISSITHPDQEKWYNNKNPKFTWEVPAGVNAVRTILGKSSTAQPDFLYEPPISSREFENLEDGIWYFAARFRNDQGWGSIGRFKVQIDTTPPKEFLVLVDNEGDLKNTTPLFKFETRDETSGIDYYEIILNEEVFAQIKPEEIKNGAWRPTNPLEPGDYILKVKAFDKAGNFTFGFNSFEISSNFVSFSIEPISLEIFAFPKKIKEGTPLKVEGKTFSGATITIFIQKGEEINKKEAKSDKAGHFKFEEMLAVGKYIIWFQARDLKGRMGFSGKYEVEVVKERLTLYLSILLIILILIGLLIILYLLRKIKKEKEKAKAEKVQKTREEKLKAYNILKEKTEEQIKYLESKVDLSRSESRVLENLKKALQEAEQIKSQEEIENQEEKI